MTLSAALISAWAMSSGSGALAPPLEAYLGPPAIASARISPDGSRVAYVSNSGGKSGIDVVDTRTGRHDVIGLGAMDVSDLEWLDDGHVSVTRMAVVEVEGLLPRQRAAQAFSINLGSRKGVTLLGDTSTVAPILTDGEMFWGTWKGRPTVFLRGLTHGPAFALFSVDLDTGVGTPITKPSFNAENWVVLPDATIAARTRYEPLKSHSQVEVAIGSEWRSPPASDTAYVLQGLSPDGGSVLLSHGATPVLMSRTTGEVQELKTPASRKIKDLIFGRDKRLLGISLQALTPEYVFYQKAMMAAWPKVRNAFAGQRLTYIDSADDGESILVAVEAASSDASYYLVNLRSLKAEKIGDARPDLPPTAYAPSREVDLAAADGLILPSVLTLPTSSKGSPPPVVVLVSPSPASVIDLGYDEEVQAIAARGYAVLRVNTRGSHLSQKLEAAGAGELGRGTQTDLLSAVADLARRGVVDGNRACVMGEDLGGWAAVLSTTLQASAWKCAVAINAPADIASILARPDPYTRGGQGGDTALRKLGPNGPDASARIAALSLYRQASQVSAPVMLLVDRLNEQILQQNRTLNTHLTREGKRVTYKEFDTRNEAKTPLSTEIAHMRAALDFISANDPV